MSSEHSFFEGGWGGFRRLELLQGNPQESCAERLSRVIQRDYCRNLGSYCMKKFRIIREISVHEAGYGTPLLLSLFPLVPVLVVSLRRKVGILYLVLDDSGFVSSILLGF